MTARRTLVVVGAVLVLLTAAGVVGGEDVFLFSGHGDRSAWHSASGDASCSSRSPCRPHQFDGLHAELVEGVPTVVTPATVLSDEQCQPDATGVSHCLNRMRLPDGSGMAVQHPT